METKKVCLVMMVMMVMMVITIIIVIIMVSDNCGFEIGAKPTTVLYIHTYYIYNIHIANP